MDGMDLTVVGCSGSVPGPAGPASCYLLSATGSRGERWRLVLDLGNGALGALQRHTDPLDLDAVLLSHLHADHCLDMANLYVMRKHGPAPQPEGRLAVHAPAGAAQRLGRAQGVTRAADLRDSFAFRSLVDRSTFDVGPFRVTPVRVTHPVETYGFRVSAGGASLAYTGDTDSSPALADLMAGADLVLTDSAFVDGRDRARGLHLSGSRAAQAAVDAGGVGRLMLTHLPPWNDPQVCRAQAATVWPGEVELAQPDATYRITAR